MHFPITVDFTPDKIERYKDLTAATRQAIVEGRLNGGQRLPSAKEMARQMGVGRTTIVKVYQQLAAEGYLETRVGSGTYLKTDAVACNPPVSTTQRYADADVPVTFVPARDVLPARQWQQTLNRHCRLDGGSGGAGVLGYRPLRQSVAEFLKLTKAVNCTPDQVVVFPSAQAAVYFITSLLVNQDDVAAVEDPGDQSIRNSLRMAGAKVKSVGVDAGGLKVEELSKITEPCKILHVTPSHQYPTGAIMPLERRRAILDWARHSNTLILEDARDSDYYYGRGALPSLQGMDDSGRVIYMYDFSTVLYPFVNLAVLVLPTSLIELAQRAMLWLGTTLPSVEHFALADFIADGELQRHIRRSRNTYQIRRQTLIYNLSLQFLKAVSIPSHGAGLHQVVRFNLPLSEAELLKCAVLAGLPMIPTGLYYERPATGLEFLIPFCMLDVDETASKVARFQELVIKEISQNADAASEQERSFAPSSCRFALA